MDTKGRGVAAHTTAAPDPEPPLSPTRAFVVQFRTGTDGSPPSFRGRVEHMPSGQAVRFTSAPELLVFFTQILTEVTEQEE